MSRRGAPCCTSRCARRAVPRSWPTGAMSCLTRLADRVHDLAQQVLVAEMNRRQAKRLRRLSDYLDRAGGSRLMFELLVPAGKAQLERPKGDKRAYNRELRPQLMVGAIEEPQ